MFEGIYSESSVSNQGDVHTKASVGPYSIWFLSCEDGYVGSCSHQELTDTFNVIDNNIIVAEQEQDYTEWFEG